jgi:potassium/hydrogen antiporter
MTVEQLNLALLVGAGVALLAVAAVRLSHGSGLPTLLAYLALGLAIGERGAGIRFDDARLTALLGYSALVLILVEGGMTTRWATIRPSVAPAAVLATLGTTVSVAVAGAAAHYLLALDWVTALLLGAMISSTDAAAVFSVLRRLPLPPRLVGVLEAESGFNDAPVVIAVVALTAALMGEPGHGPAFLVGEAVLELAIGAAVGLAVGWAGAAGLRRIALPSSGLYPIAVLSLAVLGYGLAAVLHGSGFLATYLAALVLGNSRLPHAAATRGFAEGLGWVAQIGLFVLLGLLADPFRLPAQAGAAVLLGLALLLVARPLSVVASVSWFGMRWREQVLLSWAGLRGAVPIVLTTVPVAAGVSGSLRLFDLVFVLVVVFTVVQGPSLPWLARRLGLDAGLAPIDLDVEASPLGALGAEVLQVTVAPGSQLHGVEIFELRLPAGANITLVARDGTTFVPGAQTMLRHGDQLIVVTSGLARVATEDRLRAVSAGGRLVGWRTGTQTTASRRAYPWHSNRSSAKSGPVTSRRFRRP